MSYWQDRMSAGLNKISKKSTAEIDKQLTKYYADSAQKTINDFTATYNKVQLAGASGNPVTPADLYKLDSYWQMQGQLRGELQRLGEKQIVAMTKVFEKNYFQVYNSINLQGTPLFSTIDTGAVQQLLNSVWVADGKTFSQRVWNNTNLLVDTLNDELIHCIATGKKTSELKSILQNRFNVAYHNADMIARTELAHIQTEAAKQRYKDYGIEQVQIWADPDERTCEVCGKLHKKVYPTGANVPIPAHPRCRCCIVPVIDE